MDEKKKQQIELLETVAEYTDKLIPAMEEVSEELLGDMKEDTLDYMRQVVDALNFVIEAFNATRDIVNEGEAVVQEAKLEKEVGLLSNAFKMRDYKKIGMVLRGEVLNFLKAFNKKAKEMI